MGTPNSIGFNGYIHGGDYNPEQWLEHPEILEKDIEYFKKAHINEATVGVFSWSMEEPEEGVYELDWLSEIIDRLYENGISVILATPSGARPKWMADKYPEVLRTGADRQRNFFGARHNHCLTSPVYREKVKAVDRQLAKRFGNHPGVIAWHLSNELQGECHCGHCQAEFRKWLQEKYKTVDALNLAWNTRFWSHVYNSFDQIESPSPRGERDLHGLNIEWKRFCTDMIRSFVLDETEAIRSEGAPQPTTINMMYDFIGLNYRKFADVVDFISWDSYPAWHHGPESWTAADTGLQHDLMRSIQKKPFLLMESCPSSTNWQPVSKLRRPGMAKLAALHAVAHGSDSVMYFQLRQSRGASEKFHGAVIDHYGGDGTRVLQDVTQTGEMLEAIIETAGSVTGAKAAILMDTESRWAMYDANGPRNTDLHYMDAVRKSYKAFRSYGIDVDIIDEEQPLDGYVLVAAPMLYLFRAGIEEKIRRYVENGGNFVMTYWSGIVDETDLCFLDGTPHDLMDVFGLRFEEIDGLYDGESNAAVPAKGFAGTDPDSDADLGVSFADGSNYKCEYLCELVKLMGAEPLLEYAEDFYAGKAALTVNRYGRGKAFYVCADFEEALYRDLYHQILKAAGTWTPVRKLDGGVEICSRESGENKWLFLMNFGRETAAVTMAEGLRTECVYGDFDGTLKPLSGAVLRVCRV